MKHSPLHVHTYDLTAGESDARGLMPPTLVTERVIEVATEHANALGIGYDQLITANMGWVLSRLVIEMKRYPRINDRYTLATWIEGYNRHFSQRNFEMTDRYDGSTIGYMRTVWAAMDFSARAMADLTAFERDRFPLLRERECPIASSVRLGRLPDDASVTHHRFGYCDLDFNRHVNTLRYIELILNHWSLEWHDAHIIRRLDLSFSRECRYGEDVVLRVVDNDPECPGRSLCEIVRSDGERALGAVIDWGPMQDVQDTQENTDNM